MKTPNEALPVISYACGIGANNTLCAQGPIQMKISPYLLDHNFSWSYMLTPKDDKTKLEALQTIQSISEELAEITSYLAKNREFFVTLGGDHTSAIGTWSGVANSIAPQMLGLLWIDAHLDSHTVETTPSGNIHGMPLAALLGQGDSSLTKIGSDHPKLIAENVCILGVRSYEDEERELLERLRVKVYYMEEIQKRGFVEVFMEAIGHITKRSHYYGISLDLDALCPSQAPGVGTPVPGGIDSAAMAAAINAILNDSRFIAMEIAEFNPSLDIAHKTEKIIADLLNKLSTITEVRVNNG